MWLILVWTKVVVIFLNYIWLSFTDILKRFRTCKVARSMKLNLCTPNWARFPLLSLFPRLPPFQGEEGDPLKAKAANLVATLPWGIKAPSFQVNSPGPVQPCLSCLLFLSPTANITHWTFVIFVKFQKSLIDFPNILTSLKSLFPHIHSTSFLVYGSRLGKYNGLFHCNLYCCLFVVFIVVLKDKTFSFYLHLYLLNVTHTSYISPNSWAVGRKYIDFYLLRFS